MGFKAGIVGLPNVGKSTLFNSLSSAKAEAANYPFCTIDPNIGMIPVPDDRLDKLAELANPQAVIQTVVKIMDIAGLVKGASKGEGLGNKFLANIRECDAIIHLLRCFEDPNVIHVENRVDPVGDKEIIDLELQLKDLESLEKKLEKAKKMTKGGNKAALKEVEIIQRFISHLQQGKSIREMDASPEEKEVVKELGLLTDKPVLYCCNVDEAGLPDGNKYVEAVKEAIKGENAKIMVICAAFEAQLTEIDAPDEKQEFLESYGLKEPGLSVLIRSAYELLNLKTYFTVGEKEVRAWTITEGMYAPQAAGVIHTDFERGFIRAEVIHYPDFVQHKTEQAVKDAGKMAVQGKDYIVQDGDIMHFRFNV